MPKRSVNIRADAAAIRRLILHDQRRHNVAGCALYNYRRCGMIQHIDRNRRVEQRTYDADEVRDFLISKCGPRQFLAWQLVRADGYSRRRAAKMIGCDESTVRRWLDIVDPVAQQLREMSDAA